MFLALSVMTLLLGMFTLPRETPGHLAASESLKWAPKKVRQDICKSSSAGLQD